MSIKHQLAATALALIGTAGALFAPATAQAAPPVAAGYANISGPGTVGQWRTLPAGDIYNSSGQGALVMHNGQGSYSVQFPGLGVTGNPGTALPGVVHAQSTLSGTDVCQPASAPFLASSGVMQVTIKCFNPSGASVDPFSMVVTYNRDGSEGGRLNTVRLSKDDIAQLTSPGATVAPAVQFSSLPGPITVRRDLSPTPQTPGFYTFAIPRNPGAARVHAVNVSAMDVNAGLSRVVCNVTSDAPEPSNDKIELVRVGCHNMNGTATDNPMNLTFAEDVNTLGKLTLSYANVTTPTYNTNNTPEPSKELFADHQRNDFGGVPGRVWFEKIGLGHFQVYLQNQDRQQGNLGAVSVIPTGSSTVNKVCNLADDFNTTEPSTGTPARRIRFLCFDRVTGAVWTSARFQLNYTARQ
ncbi:hypothetical protein [Nonomuraea sp. NPDC049141]|uniref:hypothetical protein n=1 Tax=Nonomuraea sp. NPDC049141 TaxID=3155500 RepID=UPI00340AC506